MPPDVNRSGVTTMIGAKTGPKRCSPGIDADGAMGYGRRVKLNVTLPPPLAALLRRASGDGRHLAAAGAARAALRLQHARDGDTRRAWLRRAIRQGLVSGPAAPLNVVPLQSRGRARWGAL
jgi:Arc/MetJ-type ribon-helix-helix transcriptional regulator